MSTRLYAGSFSLTTDAGDGLVVQLTVNAQGAAYVQLPAVEMRQEMQRALAALDLSLGKPAPTPLSLTPGTMTLVIDLADLAEPSEPQPPTFTPMANTYLAQFLQELAKQRRARLERLRLKQQDHELNLEIAKRQ